MSNAIFKEISINRNDIKWEDYLFELTPVEEHSSLWFKREDYFAPLGYGGINGSKLRQAIFLVNRAISESNIKRVISGASVKSPQLPMASAVAMHYGLDSKHVIGATKPSTAINYENIKMASWFKAKFDIIKVGYNPVLQSRVKNIAEDGDYILCYGITPHDDSTGEELYSFHELGANQVLNIPDHIKNIILPAGSFNSCISVILGLFLFRPSKVKNIHLIGIGPPKFTLFKERLTKLGELLGENFLDFNVKFDNSKINLPSNPNGLFNLFYYDLHKEGFTNYQQEMNFNYGGIDFHPTYEGKCMTYTFMNLTNLLVPESLFWIVGSKPYIHNMSGLNNTLGSLPVKLEL